MFIKAPITFSKHTKNKEKECATLLLPSPRTELEAKHLLPLAIICSPSEMKLW